MLAKARATVITIWNSIDSLRQVNFWAQSMLALLILFTFIATLIAIAATERKERLQRVKDREHEEILETTRLKARELEASAEDARTEQMRLGKMLGETELRVEQLREKNLDTEAKLEQERIRRINLEQRMSPRRLDLNQKARLVDGLRLHIGTKYDVSVVNSMEAITFLSDIESVLDEAGWVQVDAGSSAGLVVNRPGRKQTNLAVAEGIRVEVADSITDKFGHALNSLLKGLNDAGFHVHVAIIRNPKFDTEVVHLTIGDKIDPAEHGGFR